jgi:hypothetical protein
MRFKRWLYILLGAGLLFGGLYLGFGLVYADFLVDSWWFKSLGYEGYFWQRLTYRYLVFMVFTLLFFGVFFLNFWVASRYLGQAPPSQLRTGLTSRLGAGQVVQHFRTGSLKVYLPFSLLLAVLVAHPLYEQWEAALLYLFAPAAGVPDPVYGQDVGYYLFALPMYLALLYGLLLAFLLLLLGVALLYWLEGRVLARQQGVLPRGARIHLSVLLLAIFAVGVWGFLLQRHNLVYSEAHAALFFGPGFVEMWVILPLIWLSLVLLAGTAVSLFYWLHTRRGLKVLVTFAGLFILAAAARYSFFLPDLVQHYIVKPNEISREQPFIANSVKATLAAYDLDRVETREYRLDETPFDLAGPPLRASLRNIPVWDKEVLLTVYEQLQEFRTFYNFTAADVDRYTVNRVYQQVFLAARELNLKELPRAAQNWVNQWLKYTHGYGVMRPRAVKAHDLVHPGHPAPIRLRLQDRGAGHLLRGGVLWPLHRAQRQQGDGLSHRGRPHPDGLPGPGRGPGQLLVPQAHLCLLLRGEGHLFHHQDQPQEPPAVPPQPGGAHQAPDPVLPAGSGPLRGGDPRGPFLDPGRLHGLGPLPLFPAPPAGVQLHPQLREDRGGRLPRQRGLLRGRRAGPHRPGLPAHLPGSLEEPEPDAGGAQGPCALPQGHLRRPDEHLRQVPPDGPGDLLQAGRRLGFPGDPAE